MKGFVSYAHEDQKMCQELVDRLRLTARHDGIDLWSDHLIEGGDNWKDKIFGAIAVADVVLVLYSKPFFASPFIVGEEVPAIARRASAPGARVKIIPVVLRLIQWEPLVEDFPPVFHFLQELPRDDRGRPKPIRTWKPQEGGHDRAHRALRQAILSHKRAIAGGLP